MRNLVFIAGVVAACVCSPVRASWPDAYLKYTGKPDISQVENFEKTLLKASLVEIRLKSGEVLDVVVKGETIQIVMMVARNLDTKENAGLYLRNTKRTKGWLGLEDVKSLNVPIYSLLATADRLSITPWRLSYSRYGDTDFEPAKNYSFLVFRVHNWDEVKAVIAEYFLKMNEAELMIYWYPADYPRSSQWMDIAQVDELLSKQVKNSEGEKAVGHVSKEK